MSAGTFRMRREAAERAAAERAAAEAAATAPEPTPETPEKVTEEPKAKPAATVAKARSSTASKPA